MNNVSLYLGIDYGGSSVKIGLVTGDGALLKFTSLPTVHLGDRFACHAFSDRIVDFVLDTGIVLPELKGVGLDIPGAVKGTKYSTPNVKTDWHLFIDSLTHALQQDTIAVLNDADAAALGESWVGAGKDSDSLLLVTLGSALGSGLIVDNTLISGSHGAAGEIGHLTVDAGGRPCNCGRKGCLERYASARGLVQSFNEAGAALDLDPAHFSTYIPANETDAYPVFEAAKAQDPRALYALSLFTDKLAFGLAQATCVVDPALILLGGGLSQSAELFLNNLRELYRTYAFTDCKDTPIICATLQEKAGVIGAARFAMLTY